MTENTWGDTERKRKAWSQGIDEKKVARSPQVQGPVESHIQYRALLDTAYDSIVVVNAHGFIEFANSQIRNWFGYETSEVIGRKIEMLIPDRFRDVHANHRIQFAQQMRARPMGRNQKLWALRKDGYEFPVEVSLSPFLSEGETHVTAFIRDMSDQVRSEVQLKILYDLSRSLSTTMIYQERVARVADFSVRHLADVCWIYMNDGDGLRLQVMACREGNPSGAGCSSSWGSRPASDELKRLATTGLPLQMDSLSDEDLFRISAGDGQLHKDLQALNLFSLAFVPMVVRERNVGLLMLGRYRNTVNRREEMSLAKAVSENAAMAIENSRLYEQAQRAVRLREEVLAIVAHDLRNPLSVIRGYNEILGESSESQPCGLKLNAMSQAIARSTRQMERLIADLLDFAKIEAGQFSVQKTPCAVDVLVSEGLEQVKHHATQKKIFLHVHGEKNLPPVSCDPDRIKQVFGNLVSNAIKFVQPEGKVEIRFRRTPRGVEFSVTDNGPGIPKQFLPQLFSRYWQAQKTACFGNGLGLAIAKGIIDCHQGQIWVESEVDVGTSFYFTIPIIDA